MQRPGCPGVPSCAFPPRVAAACRRLVSLPYGTHGCHGEGASLPYVAPGKRIFSSYPCSALGVAPFPRELSPRPFSSTRDCVRQYLPPQAPSLSRHKGASNQCRLRQRGRAWVGSSVASIHSEMLVADVSASPPGNQRHPQNSGPGGLQQPHLQKPSPPP